MALTTTPLVMQALEIETPDTFTTARYNVLRRMTERAVIDYCKWPIERNTTTEYYDGQGYKDIILRGPFTQSVANVWFDPYGAYGQNPNGAFASNPLVSGSDYALVCEDGLSRCGLLRRLYNAFMQWPSDLWFFQSATGLSWAQGPFWPAGFGNLKVQYTFGFPPAVNLVAPFASWSGGVATFTTAYAHGLVGSNVVAIYGTGTGYDGTYTVQTAPSATTFTVNLPSNPGQTVAQGTADGIPEDIKAAVCAAVGIFRNSVLRGGPVTSESLVDYNYSATLVRDPMFMDVRMLLGPYRNTPLTGIGF